MCVWFVDPEALRPTLIPRVAGISHSGVNLIFFFVSHFSVATSNNGDNVNFINLTIYNIVGYKQTQFAVSFPNID